MDLGGIWYLLLAAVLATYVCLDGFDLGAAGVLPFVARGPEERGLVFRCLGEVWDGNEVWLVAAGGTLVLAFPHAYAVIFSGFYLPLTLVLWLLVFRGLSIELRHHLGRNFWEPLLELAFVGASALLAFILGAALGNVVRGVSLGPDGSFFNALFTDFSAKAPVGILDWYTTLAGLCSLAVLARHGALWLNLKTEGPIQERAARLAIRLTLPLGVMAVALSVASLEVQPLLSRSLIQRPWGWVFPLLAAVGLMLSHVALVRKRALGALLASCLFLAGLLASAVVGLYPVLLPSLGPGPALDVANCASGDYALSTGLCWWLPGMALVCLYFVFLYRRLPGTFRGEHEA
ncbi:MAG: cytochrome d ubiquinol oxidase subunit II [bacterium]